VCQELRSRESTADIPIIVITGIDDTESINHAYDLGATDLIEKPISWAVLPHRIRYLLRAKTVVDNLRGAERKNRAVLDTIPDVMLRLDANGVIREVVCGDSCHSDIRGTRAGQPLESFFPPEVASKVRDYIRIALTEWRIQAFEYELDGGTRFCELRLIAQDENCVLAMVRDISDRKEAAAKIHQLAFYDGLTGLPNRQQFVRDLRHEIENGKRKDLSMAVLFVDLDRFKRINDSFGHTVGDMLLKSVAERLTNCIRATNRNARLDSQQTCTARLARLGGDEFVILMTDTNTEDEACVVSTRIADALAAPFTFEGHQFVVTPSIGIAFYPLDGDNVEDLLMNADTAMYQAKDAGRNTYRFYSDTMHLRSLEHLALETDLRKAIDANEFCLHYQPKVDIATWTVVGVEALLRWQHPERGWLMPDEFIPIAEDTGLIVPLGEWVIREACAQLKRWQGTVLDDISIAVNVSGQQISGSNIRDVVLDAVSEAEIRPQRLELEITESLMMSDVPETIAVLKLFKDAGLRLSVDDFGTGYSCLAYLKKFPLNSLKIDRSFVQGLHENRDDAAICASILAMAKELGLKVIAEGVEVEAQLEFLREHGCDEFQGYLYSKPLPIDQLEDLLRRGKTDQVKVNA
jgi:diguanylate cyclase (GGDEF)-like protein